MKYLYRLGHSIRNFLARYPSTYPALVKLKKPRVDSVVLVTPTTDLVIDGYPRSGNTFAWFAFSMSYDAGQVGDTPHLAKDRGKGLVVLRASHAPAQVIRAVQYRRPVLVIVRSPVDAVVSFVLRHPVISYNQALGSWIAFHQRILPYREGFVTAAFEQVTTDFGQVMERVNARFGTDFNIFQHTEDNARLCFQAIEEHSIRHYGGINEDMISRPSMEHTAKKRELRASMNMNKYSRLHDRADALYQRYLGFAGVRREQ